MGQSLCDCCADSWGGNPRELHTGCLQAFLFYSSHVPLAVLSFEAPLAGMLTERRQTVRKQYEALQQRRALQDTTNHHRDNINLKDTLSPQPDTITSVLMLPSRVCPALCLDYTQKLQLQQQIQQVCETTPPQTEQPCC